MFLVRLVYASKVSSEFAGTDISVLLDVARENNAKVDVSGLLCFNANYFLQCLEGSRSAVNQTYQRILKDTRHSDIVLLDYKEVDERAFANWSMAYVPDMKAIQALNLQFSGSSQFNPYQMKGESAYKLMLALRENCR